MTYAPTKAILTALKKPPHKAFLFCTTPQNLPHQSPKDPHQYILLLDQCATLHQLKQIQASLTTSGLHTSPFLLGKLAETLAIRLHPDPNALPYAMLLFSRSPTSPNLFTWNTLIRGLSRCPTPQKALSLFALMLQSPTLSPNAFSYAFALKACAGCHARKTAKAIHGLVVASGNQRNSHVMNTALHAYASCGDVISARKVFEEVNPRDVVTWNAMLVGYVHNGLSGDALRLLEQMWLTGVGPTDVTATAALSACAQLKDLCLGRQIHGCVKKKTIQFEKETNVGTALIDMYAKCGCLDLARQVFDGTERKDIGVWNALLGGYVHTGCFSIALQFFGELRASGFSPGEPTLVSILCACAQLGALDVGRSIHSYVKERYPRFNVALGTALIEMYSKCGCIEGAREVFSAMVEKDVMAWSSMIRGLAVHGHPQDALELFSLMRRSGLKPDGVSFVGVLCACSHAGLVEEGLHYFESMKREYGIVPRVEHYGCMVDLLCRASRLREAFKLIDSMEIQANPIIWRSLLSACRVNLDVELAEIAVENLMKLRSDHCGDYVLLSNIHAAKGRWDDARRVRQQMKERQIRKKPAFSLIESNDRSTKEKQCGIQG